jgi:hypothetical protein
MNVHQLVLPTTTIVVPKVYVLGTQAMNLNIGPTTIRVNYQTTWSQFVTPIIPSKSNMLPISTYPVWYNFISPFVPLDLNLYPTYPIRTKGFDYSIFRNYTGYVPRNFIRRKMGFCNQILQLFLSKATSVLVVYDKN